LVLKSERATGELSLLRPQHRQFVRYTLVSKAKKFGILIGESVNMGNHIHLRLKASSRLGFQNFLRSVTTGIARKVTGARRGKKFGRFWQGLAYTRVIQTQF
jgi:REP element-mobilizing transposase RayT